MRSLLYALTVLSLPMRGAWIEIDVAPDQAGDRSSLPMRGAWIEIWSSFPRGSALQGRSPCGERGLKSLKLLKIWLVLASRSPCGERGLKLLMVVTLLSVRLSLPMRGAWIEICSSRRRCIMRVVVLHTGDVD